MTVISVSGRVRHIRPLPSDSTTHDGAGLGHREIGAADRHRRRQELLAQVPPGGRGRAPPDRRSAPRCRAARDEQRRGSRSGCCGSPGPGCATAASPASWMISSARSVSCAVMPAASSASFRPISSVAIDLTLTTSVAPVAGDDPVTIAVRLGGVARPVDDAARPRDRCLERLTSSVEMAERRVLDRRPASRSCSQSGSSATARARLSRIVWVALRMLRRSCVLASAARAASWKRRRR